MPNTGQKMDIGTFALVVRKLKDEGYARIGLLSWTEPFLNRSLQDFVALIRKHGLHCQVSTTLSLRRIDNLEQVLVAGVDHLIVSMSGFNQATYEVNHVGGKLEYVFPNLERISEMVKRKVITTAVVVRFIRFDYNAGEVESLRAYAEGLGLLFEVIEGIGHPSQVDSLRGMTAHWFEDQISKSGQSEPPETSGQVCSLMFDQITIDCQGDVYLCCAFPNYAPLKIGRYLDLTEEEILVRRYVHPFCRVCTIERRNSTHDDQIRLTTAFGSRISRNIAAAR
jgi:hypothetical protein